MVVIYNARDNIPQERLMRMSLLTGIVLTILAASAASFAAEPVTFHKHVEPILQKNCQTCHRPGQIAPMPFLTYQQVRPWAKAIKEKVVTRTMPPWFADPKYGL